MLLTEEWRDNREINVNYCDMTRFHPFFALLKIKKKAIIFYLLMQKPRFCLFAITAWSTCCLLSLGRILLTHAQFSRKIERDVYT